MTDELIDHSFKVNRFKDRCLKFKKDEGCYGTILGGYEDADKKVKQSVTSFYTKSSVFLLCHEL